MFKDNFEFMVFHFFFFSLICQICMTEGVGGGDSLFEKFDL